MAILVTCKNPGCKNQAYASVDNQHNTVCASCSEQQKRKEERKEEERWQALTLEEKLKDLHKRLRKQETAPRQNPFFPPTDG